MKILSGFLALLFLAFALLQLNDPDPIHWTLGYLAVSVSFGLAFLGKYPRWWLWGVTAVIGIWMLTASPAFIRWVQGGFPNIAGQMEDARPIIEETREFLGLAIAFAAMLFLTIRRRGR